MSGTAVGETEKQSYGENILTKENVPLEEQHHQQQQSPPSLPQSRQQQQLEEQQQQQQLTEQQQQEKQQNLSQFSHPVYKKISQTNGRINRMKKDELLDALNYLKLSTKGTKEVLQKRLKAYTKKQYLAEQNLEDKSVKLYTDYYVVIDFEATCEEDNPNGYIHEIIEFPAVLVDARKNEVVSEFRSFCRPQDKRVLSEFCKNLTGITQLQVDTAPSFQTVLQRFDDWLKKQVQPPKTFVIATDGPWDIDRFLKGQCKALKLEIPYYFHRWSNVRRHFCNFYKLSQVNLELMLQNLGFSFEGRPHSGIDDSRNIARILIQLKKDGAEAMINQTFS